MDGMAGLTEMAQLGFAALMAVLLLALVRELVPKMLAVIEANTRAMEQSAEATRGNTHALEKIEGVMGRLDSRLVRVDEFMRNRPCAHDREGPPAHPNGEWHETDQVRR
jgi:hypothetical protein